MERVALAARAWLGTMFVYSAALKLAHYDQAGRTVTPYCVAPQRLEGAAGFALPWAELFAAASLLLAVCRRERTDGAHDRGVAVWVGRPGRGHA